MFPPAKTARLCHTMKMTAKPPLILELLSPNVRGNGLAKHTEAKMMKPASIKQNKKRRMRNLTMMLLPPMRRGLGVVLRESCSLSLFVRFSGSMSRNSDVEIWFIMRETYGKVEGQG